MATRKYKTKGWRKLLRWTESIQIEHITFRLIRFYSASLTFRSRYKDFLLYPFNLWYHNNFHKSRKVNILQNVCSLELILFTFASFRKISTLLNSVPSLQLMRCIEMNTIKCFDLQKIQFAFRCWIATYIFYISQQKFF